MRQRRCLGSGPSRKLGEMRRPGQETRWGPLHLPRPSPHSHSPALQTGTQEWLLRGARRRLARWGWAPARPFRSRRVCQALPSCYLSASHGAPHTLAASVHKDQAATSHGTGHGAARAERWLSAVQPCEAVTIITSTFRMREPRHGEAERLARKRRSWDLDPSSPTQARRPLHDVPGLVQEPWCLSASLGTGHSLPGFEPPYTVCGPGPVM